MKPPPKPWTARSHGLSRTVQPLFATPQETLGQSFIVPRNCAELAGQTGGWAYCARGGELNGATGKKTGIKANSAPNAGTVKYAFDRGPWIS